MVVKCGAVCRLQVGRGRAPEALDAPVPDDDRPATAVATASVDGRGGGRFRRRGGGADAERSSRPRCDMGVIDGVRSCRAGFDRGDGGRFRYQVVVHVDRVIASLTRKAGRFSIAPDRWKRERLPTVLQLVPRTKIVADPAASGPKRRCPPCARERHRQARRARIAEQTARRYLDKGRAARRDEGGASERSLTCLLELAGRSRPARTGTSNPRSNESAYPHRRRSSPSAAARGPSRRPCAGH